MHTPVPQPREAPDDQSADFVELFFDLVFVFAITKLTHLTAHHLTLHHVGQSVLIFFLVWWAWTQFTWTLNAANTKRTSNRLITLIATAVAFVMAASVDMAFGAGGLWFAVPYVLVRGLGAAILMRDAWSDAATRAAVGRPLGVALAGLGVVLIGGFADPSVRHWWWLGAIGVDFFSGYLAAAATNNLKQVRVGHFVERHGLIVIIALGESLIVAGSAVASDERTPMLLLAGGTAVLLTCMLWWSYFGWVQEFVEEHLRRKEGGEQLTAIQNIFSFGHVPLIGGIISLAVAFENQLSHPQEPVALEVIAALGLGVVMFVGSTAGAVWRASGAVLWPRLALLGVGSAALVFAVSRPPWVGLCVVAATLGVIVLTEHFVRPESA